MTREFGTTGVDPYEPLWDCLECGTSELLGSSHPHCPACGTPQPPDTRYARNTDKIAAKDHPMVGSDLQCLACQAPNSAEANNCGTCGCPLAGARELGAHRSIGSTAPFAGESGAFARAAERARHAATQRNLASAASEARAAAEASRKRRRIVIAGVAIVFGLWMYTRSQSTDIEVQVSGHAWSRSIEIEQFSEVKGSVYCERMPPGAKLLSKRVGTNNCDYLLTDWHTVREALAEGSGRDPEPFWPVAALTRTGQGNCVRCERTGARLESYTVSFSYDGQIELCHFDRTTWDSITLGDSFTGHLIPDTDKLDCGSLVID